MLLGFHVKGEEELMELLVDVSTLQRELKRFTCSVNYDVNSVTAS